MRKYNRTVRTLLFTLSLLLIAPALMASADTSRNKQKMDDLVVTGTRTEERAIDVPVTTEIITAQDIEMSGVTEIGDLKLVQSAMIRAVAGHHPLDSGH